MAQNMHLETCEAQKPAQANLKGKARNLQGMAQNLHLKTCEALTCADELARQSLNLARHGLEPAPL
jgi:hypothetical protein